MCGIITNAAVQNFFVINRSSVHVYLIVCVCAVGTITCPHAILHVRLYPHLNKISRDNNMCVYKI